MKNKGFKIIFVIYILLAFIDLFSTLINYDLVKYLEANPLYQYGGLPLIILINICTILFYWWIYNSTNSIVLRYIIIFSLVALSITRVSVIWQNFQVYFDYVAQPEVVMAAAKQVTDKQKKEYLFKYLFANIAPFFNGVIAFILFKLDHKVNR
jgi:hypothetical protein